MARRQPGCERVLPPFFFPRAQDLTTCAVLPPQKALALKKASLEHFDRLETRAPKSREAALMLALPRLIAHAKKRAPGFSRILQKTDAKKVTSRKALAALPVTRKADLGALQSALPPLGGL